MARIRRAPLEEGEYQPPTAALAPPIANLETAALARTVCKSTRCTHSSVALYRQHMKTLFDGVRALEGIGPKQIVGASVLSRDLLTRVVRRLQEAGRSESNVRRVVRS